MRIYFLIVLFCLTFEAFAQTDISYSSVYEKILDSSKSKLIVYKSGNNYLFEVRDGLHVREQISFVNADLILPLNFDTLTFTRKDKLIVSEIAVFGSTFGANNYLILWHDGLFWGMVKTPFVRCVLAKAKRGIAFEVYDNRVAKKKRFVFFEGLFLEER